MFRRLTIVSGISESPVAVVATEYQPLLARYSYFRNPQQFFSGLVNICQNQALQIAKLEQLSSKTTFKTL